MARRPDFFIIGAAKSGTTSLYEYLKGHPEIFMSPRYFAPDLATEGVAKNMRHGRDLDEYLALFEEARDEKRLGEASVRYIYSTEAPRLIKEFQPEARVVAILPQPRRHVLFAAQPARLIGAEPVIDFEQALAAEDARCKGEGIAKGSNPILSVYRQRARYGEQLPRWFETFGAGRVHVMLFEGLWFKETSCGESSLARGERTPVETT